MNKREAVKLVKKFPFLMNPELVGQERNATKLGFDDIHNIVVRWCTNEVLTQTLEDSAVDGFHSYNHVFGVWTHQDLLGTICFYTVHGLNNSHEWVPWARPAPSIGEQLRNMCLFALWPTHLVSCVKHTDEQGQITRTWTIYKIGLYSHQLGKLAEAAAALKAEIAAAFS